MITSRSVLLRMRIISDKIVDKIETHFMFDIFFIPDNLAVREIMWEKNFAAGQAIDD